MCMYACVSVCVRYTGPVWQQKAESPGRAGCWVRKRGKQERRKRRGTGEGNIRGTRICLSLSLYIYIYMYRSVSVCVYTCTWNVKKMDASSASCTSCCIRYLFGVQESLLQPHANIWSTYVGWIHSRFWFIYSSSCSVYIYTCIYFWYYTSTLNGSRRVGATTFFSTSVCTRSVTTWGVARMSWRRYVFLHRIHPHSILIGFFFLRRKKRGNREVRGGMNHEGVEGRGERACCSGFPSSPLQLCRLTIVALTMTAHCRTHLPHVHFS